MKGIIKAAIATIVSIIISEFILLYISSLNGDVIKIQSIVYVLFIGVGQMFFPFLIFVIVSNLIVNKIAIHYFIQEKKILLHFGVPISLMIIVTAVMSFGDFILSGNSRGFSFYLKDFQLFIIFSFIVCTINYLLEKRAFKKRCLSWSSSPYLFNLLSY